ncbi:MAG: YceI family protein [Rubrivivax sp.]|jgi:polyisoprenoid-binding protein YceI|nr:YceI family protein [Rubrivivax sp.]
MNKSLIAAALVSSTLLVATGAAQAQPTTYAIDPTHTFVTWEAMHFGTSTSRGRFDKKEGTVQFDRAGKSAKVDITIDMASISTGVAPFDRHLRSADFFDAEKNPQARFVGEQATFNGNNVAAIAGTLTLRGVARPVTLTATRFNCYDNPILKREVCGGDFEATIQRSQFGMTYGLPGIPDNIRLLIQVEAVKQ